MLTKDTEIKPVEFENIPQDMRDIAAWIVWKAEPGKGGNITKVPYQVNGINKASATDSNTWSTFNEVREAYQGGIGDGIAIILNDTHQLYTLDIDGSTDHIYLEALKGKTYCEYSPSGEGVHVYLEAAKPKAFKKKAKLDGVEFELYADKRFMTVTGHICSESNVILKDDAVVNKLIENVFKQEAAATDIQRVEAYHHHLSDDEVIEIMYRSKQGDRIKALMNGDTAEHAGDHSSSDIALCNHLAFWTGKNAEQMYRIFAQSGLYRSKTDSKRGGSTYIADTIENAIFNTKEAYTPKRKRPVQPINNNVYDLLDTDKNGKPLNSRLNIQKLFEHDEVLKHVGRNNLFTGYSEIYKKPSWRTKNDNTTLWSDTDEAEVRNYISIKYGIEAKQKIEDRLKAQFYKNSYHPIKDYLSNVKWDGQQRMETFFIDFLGADDTPHNRAVTKVSLIGAVKRIFEPGSKHDTVLILQGAQGVGKSFILSKLGMEWFNDSIVDMKNKDGYEAVRSSWIIELGELSSLKRSQIEDVKQFISAKEDIYRPAYGKNIIRSPRQSVFFGSTNDLQFLKDDTGNRRFYIVNVEKNKRKLDPYKDLDQDYINKVWAEAKHLYDAGHRNYLDDKEDAEILVETQKIQSDHVENDGMLGQMEQFVYKPVPINWDRLSMANRQEYIHYGYTADAHETLQPRDRICAQIVWYEMMGHKHKPKKHDISDINKVLNQIEGLERTNGAVKIDNFYGKQRAFWITGKEM